MSVCCRIKSPAVLELIATEIAGEGCTQAKRTDLLVSVANTSYAKIQIISIIWKSFFLSMYTFLNQKRRKVGQFGEKTKNMTK